MKKYAFLTLFLTLSVSAWAGPLNPCPAGTKLSCGQTLTCSYTMTADLYCSDSSSFALKIQNGLTLNGKDAFGVVHKIVGPAGVNGVGKNNKYGILLSGNSNVTIQNVIIAGFHKGISIKDNSSGVKSQYNLISGVEAHHNVNNVATGTQGYGIELSGGAVNNTIQNCNIHDNMDEGIHMGSNSNSNKILGNAFSNQCSENIYVLNSSGNQISGNASYYNSASSSCISNDLSERASMYLKASSNNVISGNTFMDKLVNVISSSSGNQFTNNKLINSFFRLHDYTANSTSPTNNTISGGSISNPNGACVKADTASASSPTVTGTLTYPISCSSNGPQVVTSGKVSLTIDPRLGWRVGH